ncbi:hypothetical protein M9Y10_040292 [Tritrichomonas musculus]|uniref:Uncharacterized protein n=1 Tax=Tritrichomonas musculus TaxID=1915356 RepID=A0ABR2GPP4_9EUKA
MSRQLTLSFEVRPYPEVTAEAVQEIHDLPIKLYSANLSSIQAWYNFFDSPRAKNCKYLLFAKSDTIQVGSGFVSSNVHFSAFILQGIHEFLIVHINKDNFERLVKGKPLIPQDLSDAMSELLVGVMTVNDIVNETVNQQRAQYTQIETSSQEMDLMIGEANPNMDNSEAGLLTSITIWKRYEVLLFTLNNVFFAIYEHFNQIGRTVPLDYEIVKEITQTIMQRHRNDLSDDNSNF